MSTAKKKEKMSGHSHKYLCWAEKTELDRRVLAVWVAVNDVCNGCTRVNLHYTTWGKNFSAAQRQMEDIKEEMFERGSKRDTSIAWEGLSTTRDYRPWRTGSWACKKRGGVGCRAGVRRAAEGDS